MFNCWYSTGHVILYIDDKTLEYIWNVVLGSAAAGSSGGWNLTSYIRHLSHKSLALARSALHAALGILITIQSVRALGCWNWILLPTSCSCSCSTSWTLCSTAVPASAHEIFAEILKLLNSCRCEAMHWMKLTLCLCWVEVNQDESDRVYSWYNDDGVMRQWWCLYSV